MPEHVTEDAIYNAIPKPINWDELGSSAKDLWEERQRRSIRKLQLRTSA